MGIHSIREKSTKKKNVILTEALNASYYGFIQSAQPDQGLLKMKYYLYFYQQFLAQCLEYNRTALNEGLLKQRN